MTTQLPQKVMRVFEQPPDAASIFSEFVQVVGTENEVLIQFYDLVPGPPVLPSGTAEVVKNRLRVTVALTPNLAKRLGELLLEKAS